MKTSPFFCLLTDHRKCDSIINSSSPKQNTEGTQRQQTPFIYSAGGDNCALCQNVKSKPTPKKIIFIFSCQKYHAAEMYFINQHFSNALA